MKFLAQDSDQWGRPGVVPNFYFPIVLETLSIANVTDNNVDSYHTAYSNITLSFISLNRNWPGNRNVNTCTEATSITVLGF